ncbi:hypothetical protein [uncultured Bacteroides sp.]
MVLEKKSLGNGRQIIPEWLKISRRSLVQLRPDIGQTPTGVQLKSDRSSF